MHAATGHVVHIDPVESMVEQKTAAQLYLLQSYQRVNPIPEDEKDDAF
jgi:hypothetical protein